jgi:HPt (histidine-containing phosphotransfer) domain-containing protein
MRIVPGTGCRDPRALASTGQLGCATVTAGGGTLDPRALDELRASVGGDPQFVAELIDEFLDDAPRQLLALRDSATSGDAETARRAAHTLKGNGRTFGATAFSALCLESETAAAEVRLDAVVGQLDAIDDEWSRVRTALEDVRSGTA